MSAPSTDRPPLEPSGDVLERNIRALFARSWEAIEPRAEFRSALGRDLAARVRVQARAALPRAPQRRTARPARRAGPGLAWAALAAGIALLLGGLWLARERSRAGGLEELLARGDVAVRPYPDGAWRAWSAPPGTAMPLGAEGHGLELATPVGLEAARLPVLASGGEQPTRVRALAGSRLVARTAPFAGDPAALGDSQGLVELATGGLVVERGGGAPWRVRTSEGSLLVLEGEARVTHELPRDPRAEGGRWVRVVVRSGAVRIPSSEPPLELGPGEEAYLHDGGVLHEGVARGGFEGEPRSDPRPSIAGGPGRTRIDAPAPESAAGSDVAAEKQSEAPSIANSVLTKGEPLERFRVVLLREVVLPSVAEPEGHELTGAGGRFAIDGVQAGSYTVFVQAPGYAVWRRSGVEVRAPGEGTAAAIEAHLEPGITLRGSVVDADGQPIADALVVSETDCPIALLPVSAELIQQELGSLLVARTLTGADGRFALEHLRDCDQVLRADAPGLAPQSAPVLAAPAGERAEPRITLKPGGRIEGTVETAGGLPRAGHIVVASYAELHAGELWMSYDVAESSLDGSFAFAELPPGSWVVLDLGQGGRLAASPEMRSALVRRGETAQVRFEVGVDLVPLAGVLLDAAGAPLAQRSVSVLPLDGQEHAGPEGSEGPEGPEGPEGNGPPPGWRTTSSAADGTWKIDGVAPGRYAVYLAGRSTIEVIRVARIELTGRGDERFEIRAPGASLSGRVSAGGEPSVFAVVILESADAPDGEDSFVARVFTDAAGRYELPNLRAGEYRLHVVPTQGRSAFERLDSVSLSEGEPRSGLDIALAEGALLRVEVSGAGAGPLAGARVQLFDERGIRVQLTQSDRTDASGVFAAGCLKPGRWSVRISAEGFASAQRELVLAPLDERTLEVALGRP